MFLRRACRRPHRAPHRRVAGDAGGTSQGGARCRCSLAGMATAPLRCTSVTPALRAEDLDDSVAMKRCAQQRGIWATQLPEQTEALRAAQLA
jgi:hypothetical protein